MSRYPITDYNNLNLDWMCEQIGENETNITANTSSIEALEQNLADEITDRADADDDLQAQINAILAGAALDRKLNVDSKRQVIFIADSFGTVNTPNFMTRAAGALGLTDYQVIALASAGFYRAVYDQTLTFQYMLENATITLTPSLVTDVIVCGGSNDLGATLANLITALNNFKTYVTNTYANAKISVMWTPWRTDLSNTNEYINAYNDMAFACANAGVSFQNISTAWHSDVYHQNDGIHPNSNGDVQLAKALVLAMTGGDPAAMGIGINAPTITYAGGLTSIPSYALTTSMVDGMVRVNVTNASWTFDASTSISCNGSFKQYATLDGSLCINSSGLYPTAFTVPCVVFFTGGSPIAGTFSFKICANKLYGALFVLSGSAWKSGAINQVQMFGATWDVDPINN